MLLDGTGVEKDQAAALGWFRTAARSGDADAMNMVGRCYENGWGTARETAAAAEWYRRSAEAGHDWGEYNYANMLFDGIGIAKNLPLAVSWYLKAANQGHGRAMNQAGRCFEEGWGVAKDIGIAVDWYRKSAEAGYFRGQYNYATILCADGDIDEAARWFREAAKGGTLEIRRRIGQDLLSRDHVGLHDIGIRALALCCEDGDGSDYYRYGRVLLHGFRCSPEKAAGVEWLQRAASRGYKAAAAELGRLG
jgi:TPR repeat protein